MVPFLVVAFIVVPLAEIYVIVQVGQLIGALPTVLLLLAESMLGAWIVKREGARAWRALRATIGTARLPSRELADAALVLVGGTLLLTPGFLTDVVGFFFVLPPTRPLARRLLAWAVTSRLLGRRRRGGGRESPAYRPDLGGSPAQRPGRVVPGQLADDEPEGRRARPS